MFLILLFRTLLFILGIFVLSIFPYHPFLLDASAWLIPVNVFVQDFFQLSMCTYVMFITSEFAFGMIGNICVYGL